MKNQSRHSAIHDRRRKQQRQGYAVMTVVIFALVIIFAGVAFFAMSSYETRQAIYRQNSSEAFYLADGAVERARAAFLADGTWRDGFSGVAAGNGEYDLAVTDTTFGGIDDAVQLLATGRVRQATRCIEVMAELQPSAFGLTLLIMGDADVGGNLCIEGGPIHVNGDGDFGPDAVHLACGEFTDGFELLPPPLYTGPEYFPDATYYYVRGNKIAGVEQARIYNELGVDITTALGDSLTQVTSLSGNVFTYDFDDAAWISHYFDDATGIFKRAPGDVAVVVNFGEEPIVTPPGALGVSNLIFKGDANSDIHATIISTRFTGVTLADRYDTNFWTGGLTTVKQIIFEPYYGFSLIPHNFEKQGGALVQMGTEDWPALIYATGDVEDMTSNYEHIGGFIALGDWNSTGGPHIVYDSEFLEHLPGWIVEGWEEGESGTLRILRWREVADAD